ncbi:type II secretion system protein GspL [Ferrimonas gelatinilytica]|uniref:Type II secretion system protein L n=1 Tax=Ferrimonas gelatinilytica TaxID=1255257 RepID=A0ABP9SBQ3_9GAMM
MSERLVVRLGSHAQQPIPWVTWSDEQQGVISSGVLPDAEALSSLGERAGGRPVDVLVDTSAVRLTEVTLPAKAQRQANKAVPFLLEESLAEDVERMHFVIGPRHGDQLAVAVVSHAMMRCWQGWLTDAGLTCKRLVPDVLALPLVPDTALALLRLEEQVLLRTGIAAGEVLDHDWFDALAPRLVADNDLPWALYSDVEVPEGVETELQPLELPMQVLAQGLARSPINLFSGSYAPSRELGKVFQIWAKVGIAASVLFVVALIHNGLSVYQLKQQRQALNQQQVEIYKGLFPREKRVVNPTGQLQAKLRTLGGGTGGGELIPMLAKLAPAFSAEPEVRPQGLRFDADRGEVRLQLSGKSFAQFEQFRQIAGREFEVDQGALNNDETGVTGTLTVKVK